MHKTPQTKMDQQNTKGLVHVYTGNGKGKTTCAVGLALRALGHNRKVVYCHFHKEPEKYGYAEIEMLEKNGAKIFGIANGCPMFNKEITIEHLSNEINKGIDLLSTYLTTHKVDLLVMDEVNISTYLKCLTPEKLTEFILNKPKQTELVLTGRYADKNILDIADYVSIINKEKHPYDLGLLGRKGIEY